MMEPNTFFIGVGLLLLFLMIPSMWRIAVGPTALDRIVAVNVIGTKTAVLLVVIGQIFGEVSMFVDFALAYALLNFTGSLAAARYLHKTKCDESDLFNNKAEETEENA